MRIPLPELLGRGRQQNGSLQAYLRQLCGVSPWNLVAALLLALVASLTEGLSVLMLVPLLQLVGVDVGQGPVGRVAEVTATFFGALALKPTLFAVLGVFVIVVSAKAWLNRLRALLNLHVEQEFASHLRMQLYRAITNAQWVFLTKGRSTDFNHALTKELERASGATYSLLALFTNGAMLGVYVVLALVLAPRMTLLVGLCGAALSLWLYPRTSLSRKRGEELRGAYEQLFAAAGEHLSGIKTSKGLGIESRQLELFAGVVRRIEEARRGVLDNQLSVGWRLEVGSVAILSLVLYVALKVLMISGAGVLLLLFLFSRLIPRISGLQGGYQSLLNSLPAFDYVRDMIVRCEAVAEGTGSGTPTMNLQRALRFADVWFSYEGRGGTPVLRSISFTVEAGKTTAIVGPSGAGKSSLADLAVGLISPDAGRILIDGVPLEPEQRRTWRSQIGYVGQDTFLFHESIRVNLLMARPEATEAELGRALEQAAADAFVAALPEGLDTVVGDRGVRLSGGERQRLALARSLLREPLLLVLDEATSSLDTENEMRIQEAIDKLRGRMTILVIAHRLSTVRTADMIHVLERGRLVESGDWETLMRRDEGRFRALCQAQAVHEPGAVFNPPAADASLRAGSPDRPRLQERQGTPAA